MKGLKVMDKLKYHKDLLETIKTQGMSSDESETENGGQTRYAIITPSWRSAKLSALCLQLDAASLMQCLPHIGHRAIRGNVPRERFRPDPPRVNNFAVAPPGLHCNCYNPEWVMSLCPFEKAQLKLLDSDYDFTEGQCA